MFSRIVHSIAAKIRHKDHRPAAAVLIALGTLIWGAATLLASLAIPSSGSPASISPVSSSERISSAQ